MYRSAMLAGALALASLPALADQAPAVVIQVQPPGQQAPAQADQPGQAPAAQSVRPEPVVESGTRPPAQTVGVAGVPPSPSQAR